MQISNDIIYIGVNDHQIDLFEGQYPVPKGISYNSYMILDDKIAILDTVDINFSKKWLINIENALNGRKPDYLIIHHMEMDHSSCIVDFINKYPSTIIVSSLEAFKMMKNFFNIDLSKNTYIINENDTLSLGKHSLTFFHAPMVHWPEVIVSYDNYEKVLFSADGFGKFGALDVKEDWLDEARRYYIGIVGKYGQQVQNLLKKVSSLNVKMICPLHGPILKDNLDYYINLYDIWSSYKQEKEGIVIAYTSIYGNTKEAIELLITKLKEKKTPDIKVFDLARDSISEAIAAVFAYGKLVLATTTYNSDIFPYMKTFINGLTERNIQNKTIALIENGSWAPLASSKMKNMLSNCKNLTFCKTIVHIKSSLSEQSRNEIENLSDELCKDYSHIKLKTNNKDELSVLFNIGYGLYVITSFDGQKHNGLIVNTITQVTNIPNRIAVTINKQTYSHDVIKHSRIMNINCLTTNAPFNLFKTFGFQSGKDTDKFKNSPLLISNNGLAYLANYINSYISLKVEQYIDLDTHGMFICTITESKIISNEPTMTYTYYLENIKPKSKEKKKGFVCKICGYIYEGESLPKDYICPICKHGVSDFEPINQERS